MLYSLNYHSREVKSMRFTTIYIFKSDEVKHTHYTHQHFRITWNADAVQLANHSRVDFNPAEDDGAEHIQYYNIIQYNTIFLIGQMPFLLPCDE